MRIRSLQNRPLRLASDRLFGWLFVSMFALAGLGARAPSAREEIRFGVEAASQGLWREALFRWERALKNYPENSHLRNNLAVAYESLGRLEEAEAQYKEAMRLEPSNKEIHDNYEGFQQMVKQLQGRRTPPAPMASGGTPAPVATPSPGAPPASEPAPTPAPSPAPEAPPVRASEPNPERTPLPPPSVAPGDH